MLNVLKTIASVEKNFIEFRSCSAQLIVLGIECEQTFAELNERNNKMLKAILVC